MAKAIPMTKLEKLLARAFTTELCQGGGDAESIKRWAKRTRKRILKTIKIKDL